VYFCSDVAANASTPEPARHRSTQPTRALASMAMLTRRPSTRVCGMTVDPETSGRPPHAQRARLLVLRPGMRGRLRPRPSDSQGQRRLRGDLRDFPDGIGTRSRNMISGMGFYREQVLPRIQDKVMGRKPNRAIP